MPKPRRIAPRRRHYLLLTVALTLIAPLAGHAAGMVERSSVDTRDYRVLRLTNELQVLLISDPDTDKAAAAVDVNVGYYSDPPARPGLAHFLEHMLFLGTEKYPGPGSYQEFISTHGGSNNAYTGAEHTVYFFDIEQGFLEQALDRFAQFFIAPLFDRRFVEREMKAVESEYRLKIKDDARRLRQVHKETANPAHPFSKFSVGNLETLRDGAGGGTRAALIEFHRAHYSANLMTAVVLGAEPLDELERMVAPRLGRIRNTGKGALQVDEPVYTGGATPARINVVPLKDRRELHLEFIFPWRSEYRLTKPQQMISHLLGHEGEGSLYALLKDLSWVDRLSVGSHRIADNEAGIDIRMVLTEKGRPQIEAITDLVFQYIRLVKRHGVKRWIYEELVRINELEFRFREPLDPIAEVAGLAGNLHDYPPALVIRGPFHFAGYDADAVRDILARLTPRNARMTVVAPGVPTDSRDRWYDTPYAVRPIPERLTDQWMQGRIDDQLAIPAKNIFLPEEAALKEIESPGAKAPVRIVDRRGLRVWHKQDDRFRVPKADILVNVDSPVAVDTPLHNLMTALYLGVAEDALNAYTYPARMAGLRYHLYKTKGGFGFSVSGYDEKQRRLIDVIVDKLLGLDRIDPEVFAETFAVRKEQHMKAWKNHRLRKPYRQLDSELHTLLHEHRWRPETLLEHAADVTAADLKQFIPRLLSRSRVEVLAHGNLTAAEAAALGEDIADRFLGAGRAADATPRQATRLERGTDYLQTLGIDHEDSAVTAYYQAPDPSIESAARVLLLRHMLKARFFNELRTQRQLGYVVYTAPVFTLRVPGLRFVVQSPTLGPRPVLQQVDAFLARAGRYLEGMDPDEFEQHKQGLLALLRERDKTLHERSQRYRGNLALRHYGFDRREQLAAAVERLGPDRLAGFFHALVGTESRSRIVIQSSGNAHQSDALSAADGFDRVGDPAAFKKTLPGFEL